MKLKVKLLTKNGVTAPVPGRATAGSAGYDLSACMAEPLTLQPGQRTRLDTGVCVQIPEGYVGLVCIRSSLGVKHGIMLTNSVGVIDSDYRGEIMIGVMNTSGQPYTINPLDRIAQLVIVPFFGAETETVPELDESARSDSGFGSTGKK